MRELASVGAGSFVARREEQAPSQMLQPGYDGHVGAMEPSPKTPQLAALARALSALYVGLQEGGDEADVREPRRPLVPKDSGAIALHAPEREDGSSPTR